MKKNIRCHPEKENIENRGSFVPKRSRKCSYTKRQFKNVLSSKMLEIRKKILRAKLTYLLMNALYLTILLKWNTLIASEKRHLFPFRCKI